MTLFELRGSLSAAAGVFFFEISEVPYLGEPEKALPPHEGPRIGCVTLGRGPAERTPKKRIIRDIARAGSNQVFRVC